MDEQAHWNTLRNGDMAGLRALYDLHAGRLYAYGMTLVRREDKVRDAIHDLFLYIWQQREKLAVPQSGKAYLMVSLRRRLFDKRVGDLDQAVPVEDTDAEATMSASDAETDWIRQEDDARRSEHLAGAMARLSDRQREILHMKYFEQMDYDAIGAVMDLNYQSARNLVNRALNALRREMTGLGIALLILWGLG
jgi:RNA polymerase sigma factor (sigma-70 family)